MNLYSGALVPEWQWMVVVAMVVAAHAPPIDPDNLPLSPPFLPSYNTQLVKKYYEAHVQKL